MSLPKLQAARLPARGEAGGAHLHGEGFKRVCSSRSRSWTDNINVVKVSDNLSCRMCRGYALEVSLDREGEQEGADTVPLLHAPGGEDRGGVLWRPSWKERGGVFLSCMNDCLARGT
jgi:hypothetical protein